MFVRVSVSGGGPIRAYERRRVDPDPVGERAAWGTEWPGPEQVLPLATAVGRAISTLVRQVQLMDSPQPPDP